ncbi:MAG: right-handed parallel beta-helix repeat-containing protein [Armatimonadetes bacterium]|nr:right-handed parallel beta-helix repeat-containing protein [Armatimonadota bacterium]
MLPLLTASLLTIAAPAWYVDSAAGDDARDGRSPARAWRSLKPAEQLDVPPGGRLLLKAGGEYAGPLTLRGSGTAARPNLLGRYGDGPAPRIVTGGGDIVLTLANVQHWEVSGLDLSGGRCGVLVRAREMGLCRALHFRDLAIHDIHGGLTGDDGGFLLQRDGLETWFDDVLIEGCRLDHVDRHGILHTDYPKPTDEHHTTRLVIRGNQLRDIGGDGIFILSCDGAVIEKNTVRYAHQRVGRRPGERACAGLWPHRCNGTIVQLNEVSHTAVGGVTVWDSEAFDDDNTCRGTIFQYNHSHDNAGGFLLLCGGARGTIVRYNLSENDAVATFTAEGDGTGDATIYNNTVYVGPGLTASFLRNTFGAPDKLRFYNNLLYAAGRLAWQPGSARGVSLEHNAHFGDRTGWPEDPHAILADPLLLAPGTGPDGCRLRRGSPCAGAGRIVPGNGGRDLRGERVSARVRPAVGACQP